MIATRKFSRRSRCRVPLAAALALALALAHALPARAAGWTSGARTAGYADGGRFAAMWFTCDGLPKGRARLVFGGFEPRLDSDLDRTVVVTVDGTAFRQTTRAERDAANNGSRLVRSAPLGEFAGLLAALKSGSKAEIASPKGRSTITLKGSGKALAAFEAGCG